MNAIISYIENLFSSFPDNEETRKLKKSLLDSSQDRYYDLKNQGKSENEAVGAVISEFGDVDEIKKEMNINTGTYSSRQEEIGRIYVDKNRAVECIEANKKSAIMVAVGVFLCIFAVSTFLFLSTQNTFGNEIVPIGFMLLIIAFGVVLFVVSSSLYDEKADLKKENVTLSNDAKDYLQKVKSSSKVKTAVLLSIGILMEITSPVILLFGNQVIDQGIATAIMLFWIAIGTFLIILSTEPAESSEKLLSSKSKCGTSAKKTKANKIMGIFNSILWPIATLTFLYFGFAHGAWHPAWVIYPICGVITGIVGSIIGATDCDGDEY